MHFEDIRQRDDRTISFEFFPPASSKALESLRARLADFISLAPSFISVTYGAGGSTRERTHDLVVELQGSGQVDPIPHLTCVQQTGDEVQEILERYASSGVSNLLALRGDRPTGDDEYEPGDDEYSYAIDLVKHICRFNDSGLHPDPRGFGIGVAGFPCPDQPLPPFCQILRRPTTGQEGVDRVLHPPSPRVGIPGISGFLQQLQSPLHVLYETIAVEDPAGQHEHRGPITHTTRTPEQLATVFLEPPVRVTPRIRPIRPDAAQALIALDGHFTGPSEDPEGPTGLLGNPD